MQGLDNVELKLVGSKLTIEIDLTKVVADTQRGNHVIATSNDWHRPDCLPRGWFFNIVLTRKPGSEVPK